MRTVKLAAAAFIAAGAMALSFAGVAGAAPGGGLNLGGGLVNIGGTAPLVNLGNVAVCGVSILGTVPVTTQCSPAH